VLGVGSDLFRGRARDRVAARRCTSFLAPGFRRLKMTRATMSTFTPPSPAAHGFRRFKMTRATTNTFNNNWRRRWWWWRRRRRRRGVDSDPPFILTPQAVSCMPSPLSTGACGDSPARCQPVRAGSWLSTTSARYSTTSSVSFVGTWRAAPVSVCGGQRAAKTQ